MTTEVRKSQNPMLTTEPWPFAEASTRNCRHCLAPKDGVHVRCSKSHPLVGDYSRHKRQLTYNGVITVSRLLQPCLGCTDFDNDWVSADLNQVSDPYEEGKT